MKKNYIILCLLLVVFASCNKDEDKLVITFPENAVAPVLSMDGETNIIINESNLNSFPVIFNWSKTDFGSRDIAVEYTLEIDVKSDFKSAQTATIGTNKTTYGVSATYLNDLVINKFKLSEDAAHELYVRISSTTLKEGDVENSLAPVVSNTLIVTVKPFYIEPDYPENMYMIGNEFGSWDWSSSNIVEMTPVHGKQGHFWCIRYFSKDNGFKWNSTKAWGGDFNQLSKNDGFLIVGGDAFVSANGIYSVYVDMEKEKITMERAKVYGMGDCFGGWDAGTYSFTEDGKVMKITTSATGELRMYAASAGASSDWWTREFILRNGVIDYRGTGDDQLPRVNVSGGKTVILDFNAGTGTIE